MDQQTTIALLSGGFALVGGLGGVLASGSVSRRAEDRRLKADDDRRWLTDRRTTYAAYLGLAESMLREIDSVAIFLSRNGTDPIPDVDEQLLSEGLLEYMMRWDHELQPALGDVELLASPEVTDLADRVSSALIDLTATVELRGAFDDHYPMWFQTQDLIEVLKNAMRGELGLPPMSTGRRTLGRRANDWPWLPDRPSRESYRQSSRPDQPTP